MLRIEYYLCSMYCAEFNNYPWTKTCVPRTNFFFSHKVPWPLTGKLICLFNTPRVLAHNLEPEKG